LVRQNVTNGAVVVLDNRTGEILVWAGSRDFFDPISQGQVDGVLSLRQPGSALKPFLFGLWFERGGSPSDWIEDAPFTAADGYAPRNYDEKFHGWMTLRTALGCSYNVPVIRLSQRFKPGDFLEFLHRCGFYSLKKNADFYGSGLALGNGEVTLLELTSAYSMLARGGLAQTVKWFAGQKSLNTQRVLTEDSAYLVTNVLCDPVARTPSFGMHSPLRLPFDFGAKTGTSKDYRDNWAVGYTPEWTVGVWVGNFDGKPMEGVSGVTGAGGLLHDVALTVYKSYPSSDFKVPDGIKTVAICPDSGDLPSAQCPNSVLEVFAAGNVPKETCRHGSGILRGVNPNPSLKIVYPRNGDVFKLDTSLSRNTQSISLLSNRTKNIQSLTWILDGKEVPWDGNGFWWSLTEGKHELVLKNEVEGSTSQPLTIHFSVLR
jgi:penicillin-binding protein 1C